jgi:hypothetical protein
MFSIAYYFRHTVSLRMHPQYWDTLPPSPLPRMSCDIPLNSPHCMKQVVQLFFFYCGTSLSVFVTPDLCLFNSEDNELRLQFAFLVFNKSASHSFEYERTVGYIAVSTFISRAWFIFVLSYGFKIKDRNLSNEPRVNQLKTAIGINAECHIAVCWVAC